MNQIVFETTSGMHTRPHEPDQVMQTTSMAKTPKLQKKGLCAVLLFLGQVPAFLHLLFWRESRITLLEVSVVSQSTYISPVVFAMPSP